MQFNNIYDILKSDCSLSFSYELAEQIDFNRIFLNESQRFTYFVPSNEAWDQFNGTDPSEYYSIVLKIFDIRSLFQRFLIIGQQFHSTKLNEQSFTILTMRTIIKVIKESDGNLWIEWEGLRSRIVRPDIQATNGVIHVIDRVLMIKRHPMPSTSSKSSIVINIIELNIIILIIKKFKIIICLV